MPDYDKIGREVLAMFTGSPVEPETEEGRMVADLRYPGWREKGMPPLVPTPEAAERWGRWWWHKSFGDVHVVRVVPGEFGACFYTTEVALPQTVMDCDAGWLGPVLERPVKP